MEEWEKNLAKYDESNLEEDLNSRHYKCSDCRFCNICNYKCPCDKRIDHQKIRFALPWFKSYQGDEFPACKEFQPNEWQRWDYKYWRGWEDYFERYKKEHFGYYKGDIPEKQIEKTLLWFVLNGNKKIRYGVKYMDWVNGTLMEGNKLKTVKKMYCKKDKIDLGIQLYKIVYEDIEYIEIK
jgi:hypothetical protein